MKAKQVLFADILAGVSFQLTGACMNNGGRVVRLKP